jgi:hypothetical protein
MQSFLGRLFQSRHGMFARQGQQAMQHPHPGQAALLGHPPLLQQVSHMTCMKQRNWDRLRVDAP